jgi:hypothetical protein
MVQKMGVLESGGRGRPLDRTGYKQKAPPEWGFCQEESSEQSLLLVLLFALLGLGCRGGRHGSCRWSCFFFLDWG